MSMNKRSQTRYPLEIHLQMEKGRLSSFFSTTLGSIKNAVCTFGLSSFLFFKYPPTRGGAWGPVEKAPDWSFFCLTTWCSSPSAEVQWETFAPHTKQKCLHESIIDLNSVLWVNLSFLTSPPVSIPARHNFGWSWGLFQIPPRAGVTGHWVHRSIAFISGKNVYFQQLHLFWN